MSNVKEIKNSDEYRRKYMEIIDAETKVAVPAFIQNFTLARMKHYGIDKRYVPPDFRNPTRSKEITNPKYLPKEGAVEVSDGPDS